MSFITLRNLAGVLVLSAGVALSGTMSAAPPVKGKGDEALDRLGRIADVAGQKAENDVRVAVMAATTSKSREKSIEILINVKGKIENNQTLPDKRRASLVRMLDARIKALEAEPDAKALSEKEAEKTIKKFEDRIEDEKKLAEQKRLQKGLKEVLDLQQNGKLEEARAKAKEIAREFPSSPAAQASHMTMSGIDTLVSLRSIKNDKAKGFDDAIRSVDKSAVIPKGDIEFPKDWKQKSEYRLKKYGPVKLSPKEQAIVQALNRPISVDFKGDRFEDVMQYLSTLINQPILLDRGDLKEAQIDYETPVNLAVKNVTLRTILRKVLGEYGLTYIVKDETIQIVSQAKARETMVIRAYPVGDLLGVGGGPGDPLTNFFGPGIGQIQRMQNIANLLQMIQTTVDPNSWQINGGPGTVAFDYGTMSLVIKNSAEVHAMIGGGYMR